MLMRSLPSTARTCAAAVMKRFEDFDEETDEDPKIILASDVNDYLFAPALSHRRRPV
jgi:hypothetical protein